MSPKPVNKEIKMGHEPRNIKTMMMTYDKSTKGTHVYRFESGHGLIRTLYLVREQLPDTPPNRIEVGIKYGT